MVQASLIALLTTMMVHSTWDTAWAAKVEQNKRSWKTSWTLTNFLKSITGPCASQASLIHTSHVATSTMTESLSVCSTTTLSHLGISSTTLRIKRSKVSQCQPCLIALKRTSHGKVSIMKKRTSVIPSIDKVNLLLWMLKIQRIIFWIRWLKWIWARCILSITLLWQQGVPVMSSSLRFSMMMFLIEEFGSNIMLSMPKVSSSTLKVMWGFRLQLMRRSSSIMLTQKITCPSWKMSCGTTWLVTRWCLDLKYAMVLHTNQTNEASPSTAESTNTTSMYQLSTVILKDLLAWSYLMQVLSCVLRLIRYWFMILSLLSQ